MWLELLELKVCDVSPVLTKGQSEDGEKEGRYFLGKKGVLGILKSASYSECHYKYTHATTYSTDNPFSHLFPV